MKLLFVSAVLICMGVTAAAYKGEVFESDDLRIYPIPENFPVKMPAPKYRVRVNGHELGLYVDTNVFKGLVHFAAFEFDPSKPVKVDIFLPYATKKVQLLPAKYGLKIRHAAQLISFEVKEPDSMITLILGDNYQQSPVLHLFANAITRDPPTRNTPGVHYFGPGYHDLKAEIGKDELHLDGNDVAYLALGAVIDGKISLGGSAKLWGSGMLMRNRYEGMLLTSSYSRDAKISGVIAYNSKPQCWTCGCHEVNGLEVNNLKIVAPHYASTDGFDVVNSKNIHFKNCFVRASDDAVVLKGLAGHDKKISECPPNENLLFEQMQLWNDCNNAFNMGAEARASAYRNITLRDSDILFSYDDPNHHGKLDERSAMSISVVDGTGFENILFEDIRVYRCERLICLNFLESFWFGSLKGDQTGPGGIKGITFRRIYSPNNSGSPIANQILLHAWNGVNNTPVKRFENVLFEDVIIQGRPLTANSPFIRNETPKLIDLKITR